MAMPMPTERDYAAAAAVALAEARGHGPQAMAAVVDSLVNRAEKAGVSVYEIAMANNQYAGGPGVQSRGGLNGERTANYQNALPEALANNGAKFQEALSAVHSVLGPDAPNRGMTNGALSFISNAQLKAQGYPDDWGPVTKTAAVGPHTFVTGPGIVAMTRGALETDLMQNVRAEMAQRGLGPGQVQMDLAAVNMFGGVPFGSVPDVQFAGLPAPNHPDLPAPPDAKPEFTLASAVAGAAPTPGYSAPSAVPGGSFSSAPKDPTAFSGFGLSENALSTNPVNPLEPGRPGGYRGFDSEFAMTSDFGPRTAPRAGASSYHRGEDYGAPIGTPYNSPQAGTVVSVGDRRGYGTTVQVDHGPAPGVIGQNMVTTYAHLSAVDVQPGQRIEAGTTIGKVGNTGISSGPHAHYGVSTVPSEEVKAALENGTFLDGGFVNPQSGIAKSAGLQTPGLGNTVAATGAAPSTQTMAGLMTAPGGFELAAYTPQTTQPAPAAPASPISGPTPGGGLPASVAGIGSMAGAVPGLAGSFASGLNTAAGALGQAEREVQAAQRAGIAQAGATIDKEVGSLIGGGIKSGFGMNDPVHTSGIGGIPANLGLMDRGHAWSSSVPSSAAVRADIGREALGAAGFGVASSLADPRSPVAQAIGSGLSTAANMMGPAQATPTQVAGPAQVTQSSLPDVPTTPQQSFAPSPVETYTPGSIPTPEPGLPAVQALDDVAPRDQDFSQPSLDPAQVGLDQTTLDPLGTYSAPTAPSPAQSPVADYGPSTLGQVELAGVAERSLSAGVPAWAGSQYAKTAVEEAAKAQGIGGIPAPSMQPASVPGAPPVTPTPAPAPVTPAAPAQAPTAPRGPMPAGAPPAPVQSAPPAQGPGLGTSAPFGVPGLATPTAEAIRGMIDSGKIGAPPDGARYGWGPNGVSTVWDNASEFAKAAATGPGIFGAMGLMSATPAAPAAPAPATPASGGIFGSGLNLGEAIGAIGRSLSGPGASASYAGSVTPGAADFGGFAGMTEGSASDTGGIGGWGSEQDPSQTADPGSFGGFW